MDLLLEAEGLVHGLLDVSGERYGHAPGARDVNAPDFSFAPDHNGLSVRQPRVLRVEPVDRPRFLEVLVEVIEDRAIAAAFQIADVQLAAQSHAADVRERFTVRADPRRH